MSILIVKVVCDKVSGHTCRASVSSSPLLTDLFDGIQLVVGTYIILFLVCVPRLGSTILSFPLGVLPWVGAFPNAAQCLLCSESPNSLISLYCSGDTPVTIEFPSDPRNSTSTRQVSPSRTRLLPEFALHYRRQVLPC